MRSLALILLVATALSSLARAEEQTAPAKLKVGVFDRPPFAMKDADGHWTGLSVDLWEEVSRKLKLDYEYVETPLDDVVMALHDGKIDVSLGELGVSAERERLIDFTQPYLVTAAAVAFRKETSLSNWRHILNGITHDGLMPVLAAMLGTLFIFSLLLWLLERGAHQSHFGGKPIHGFGSALWFSAVTMTTVGYGDKTPQTALGRFLAFIWMFTGILLVSAFTGSVASSITVAELNSTITHVSDLGRFRNGVLDGSLADNVLTMTGIRSQRYQTVEEGLKALQERKITAFSGDAVTLRYIVQRDFPDEIRVANFPSTHLTFAMATRPDFPQLQALNVAIIERVSSPDWQLELSLWGISSTVQ